VGAPLDGLLRALVAGPLDAAGIAAWKPAVDGATPAGVVDAVDRLVGEGCDLELLKPAVSKFLNLVHRVLKDGAEEAAALLEGDPLGRLLAAENRAILAALDRLRPPLAALNASLGLARGEAAKRESEDRKAAESASLLARELAALDPLVLHYVRLENVVFPRFEALYPRYRCLSLMWSLHDDLRSLLRTLPARAEHLARALGGPGLPADDSIDEPVGLNAALGRLFFTVYTLVFREERLLLPVALPLLGAGETGQLAAQCAALGAGFLRGEALTEALRGGADGKAAIGITADDEALDLDAGRLLPSVIDAILKTLPLDLTFVDADDRVRYFSNGDHRIFPRSPAVLGREVRNCHPAASVDRVMGLIEAFRKGERDREAFWIERKGRFVHIEYFALRDAAGRYLGTLEASEDLTEKRALVGEKRLSSPSSP